MPRGCVTPSAPSQLEKGLLFDVYLRGELILALVTACFWGDFRQKLLVSGVRGHLYFSLDGLTSPLSGSSHLDCEPRAKE